MRCLPIFRSAVSRSASASANRVSKSVGSKRTTTSPARTALPSGASQAIFTGPGTPGGTVTGVARAARRLPSAGTRWANGAASTT